MRSALWLPALATLLAAAATGCGDGDDGSQSGGASGGGASGGGASGGGGGAAGGGPGQACAESPMSVVEGCVPTVTPAGDATVVRLAGACGGCADRSVTCEVAQTFEEPGTTIINLFPMCAQCAAPSGGCSPPDAQIETTCAIGPLPGGPFEVRVNNLAVGRTEVGGAGAADMPCFDPRATEGADCSNAPLAWDASCGHTRVPTGSRAYFRFDVQCGSCQLDAAPCDVSVSGDAIELSVFGRTCSCQDCGACQPICYSTSVGCSTTVLAAGRYRVIANGRDQGTLEVAEGAAAETTCL